MPQDVFNSFDRILSFLQLASFFDSLSASLELWLRESSPWPLWLSLICHSLSLSSFSVQIPQIWNLIGLPQLSITSHSFVLKQQLLHQIGISTLHVQNGTDPCPTISQYHPPHFWTPSLDSFFALPSSHIFFLKAKNKIYPKSFQFYVPSLKIYPKSFQFSPS